jgi:hypothetical protein
MEADLDRSPVKGDRRGRRRYTKPAPILDRAAAASDIVRQTTGLYGRDWVKGAATFRNVS